MRRTRITHIAHLLERPEVTIEYFVPDDRKAGGVYVTVTGRVRNISVPEKTLWKTGRRFRWKVLFQ